MQEQSFISACPQSNSKWSILQNDRTDRDTDTTKQQTHSQMSQTYNIDSNNKLIISLSIEALCILLCSYLIGLLLKTLSSDL